MPLGKEVPCEEGVIVQAVMYPTGQQLADFCNRLRPILEVCEGWSDSKSDKSKQPFYLVLAFYPIARLNKEEIRD